MYSGGSAERESEQAITEAKIVSGMAGYHRYGIRELFCQNIDPFDNGVYERFSGAETGETSFQNDAFNMIKHYK